jgi:hypothetical protein
MMAFFCELLLSCVLAAPGARGVDELAYGNLLFEYFQEDHEAALLESMIAETRGQQGAKAPQFRLAAGSLAFAEGLYRMSDAAYAGLDPEALQPVDRMRLAFHRARDHHRRDEFAAMTTDLDAVRFDPTWFGRDRHHPEIQFMRAEARLAAGDFAGAELALAPLAENADWLGYGLFNLAAARRAAGDLPGAQAALLRLADLPLASRDGMDLVARSRLALALLARERGAGSRADSDNTTDAIDATAVLDALPAGSRYREQALAVYGDLAMRRGDYRLAARIWLTLEQYPKWHAGRAAAGLGLPLALERMDRPDAALDGYRRAAGAFAARLTALNQLASETTDAAWTGRLLKTALGAKKQATAKPYKPGSRNPVDTLPGVADAFGSGAWIAWLADDDVTALLDEWRTLDRMSRWLDALPDRLVALDEVKNERLRRSAAAREALAQNDLPERRDALVARIDTLHKRIGVLADPAAPVAVTAARALADPAERKLLDRLDQLDARLTSTPDAASVPGPGRANPADRTKLATRIARLRGTVLWNIADSHARRVRSLERELADVRELLGTVDARIARLTRAEAELDAGAAADFRAVAARGSALAAAVASRRDATAAELATSFRGALQHEIALTDGHLMTARIAIARTTDQLASAGSSRGPES